MKNLLIVLLFSIFGFQNTSAQALTFRTSSVSITEKNEIGKWSAWSDFVKADLVITIDGRKNRIVINSPEIQVFTILIKSRARGIQTGLKSLIWVINQATKEDISR